MVEEINRKEVEYFRFHASGDFYNESYVRKVIAIAKDALIHCSGQPQGEGIWQMS